MRMYMAEAVFHVIIAIIVLDFVIERTLAWLNLNHRPKNIPEELEGIYDPESYSLQQQYQRSHGTLALISSSFSFVILLLMLLLGGFGWLDSFARSFSEHPVVMALIFFGIIGLASNIMGIPFSVYGTFVIEEKFGFNRTTPATFVLDRIKSLFIGAVIGGGLLSLIIWFYSLSGKWFCILAWVLVTLFSIFMGMFYSTLIVPLFNRQTPLEQGELRNKIQEFAKKTGFRLTDIFVIDGSRRSTRANAYFTGLGPKKRIVLYDTLINDLTSDEVLGVLAHEIGHYLKKHVRSGMILGSLNSLVVLFIFSRVISFEPLSISMGADAHSFHMALVAFGILFSPVSFVTGILMNRLSRKREFEADLFVKKNHDARLLIDALKKLTAKNYSDLTPHPAYVSVHYSHPTLLQRIRALEQE